METMPDADQLLRFARAVRKHRLDAGMTQSELAARSGVSVRTIRAVEQGRAARPHTTSLARLADAVGLAWPPTGPRISVLGPLTVETADGEIRWGSRKSRVLLAVLAMHAGQPVSRPEIVDALWGEEPPPTCQNLVHGYIARVRAALEDPSTVEATRRGYRLVVRDGELDLLRFDALITRARDAEPTRAVGLLGAALDLWRGPLLADLPDAVRGHPAAHAITARRTAAAGMLADLALAHGVAGEAVERLWRVAVEEPLHEGLHARLVLALAADGRQAAALEEFARIRDRLVDELGVEPGAELREAHVRVLRQDLPDPQVDVPAQLPVPISHFTGRRAQLARLDGMLAEQTRAVLITAIAGTAGVGKTALATAWANHVRDRFPDGQLYVDLRGFAANVPMRPAEALGRFLRAFGVPPERVPAEADEAAALYRTLLADRRVLVVLDNAAGADQVRPLLPSGPGSMALITSRNRLGGMAAHEGLERLALDVLSPDDARALLERTLGAHRTAAEPQAAGELAELCAYLPLALRVVAANLADQPHRSIADQVVELREGNRLAELSIDGTEEAAVRTAFGLSYQRLAAPHRRLFRLLGAVPGRDFTGEVAAALLDADQRDAERGLRVLLSAHLVQEHSPGRYGFHDLLRLYAQELAEPETAAAQRLYRWYLGQADGAARAAYPHMLRLPVEIAATASFPAPEAALSWLNDEISNLAAAVVDCRLPELRPTAWLLADALRGYLWLSMKITLWESTATAAIALAQEEGDTLAAAAGSFSLSGAHLRRSDLVRAAEQCAITLTLARRAGWVVGEVAASGTLGSVHYHLGELEQATTHLELAMRLATDLGLDQARASTLITSGNVAAYGGDLDEAERRYREALVLCRAIGSPYVEAMAMGSRADVLRRRGRTGEARDHLLRALAYFREVGDRASEGRALVVLADIERTAGDAHSALALAEVGLELGRQSGESASEVDALISLGRIREVLGEPAHARDLYREALALARRVKATFGEVRALIGIGDPESLREALATARTRGYRLLEQRALARAARAAPD
ncbi:BTAD domain-containing putative transcriptional regulator [Actinosynnema sp. CS-041913]|uniref:BTAD domain-containing putative transcriptional regulator n=1 Tax=Actinosynnema sp. CS-041913 TaxID=3239917 RepID=UPI003D8B1CA4